ncbi:MAG TPA: (d)CMP kinase [Blastocatellia bacterium]|nr:(d)CMP kinase [Blastocatellia bacterium]
MIIAIDGPVGSGKSTVGRRLAERLGYRYMDTGAMYRALAWKALKAGIPLDDAEALTALAEQSEITLAGDATHLRVLIDGEDVTDDIRSPEISRATSLISTIAGVRRALVAQQRRIAGEGNVVVEGRDIGTVVFPRADVKFYLDARVEVRARRRWEEERARGRQITLDEVTRQTRERDRRDAEREASPLRPADDAILIDSSDLTVDEVVERMMDIIGQRSERNGIQALQSR